MLKRNSTIAIAFAWLMFVGVEGLLLTSTAVAQPQCPAPEPLNPWDGLRDDRALNCLLAQGGTIALQPWQSGQPGYLLEDNLRIRVDGTVLTSTTQNQSGYARLVASPNLQRMMIRMDESNTPRTFELSWLIIDGNKHNRLNNYPVDCRPKVRNGQLTDYKEESISVSVKGASLIRNNVFENAMCGSSLEVSGTGFQVYSNTVQNSGFPDGTFGYQEAQPYADGITVLTCTGSSVTGNYILNATDVGIVVGLDNSVVNGCNVSNNTVTNDSAFAFAGIANGGSQPRLNTTVSNNVITASFNKLAFGMWLGEGPWGAKPATPTVGLVQGNTVTGAVVNLGIDNIQGGTVTGNVLYNARGNAGMLGCVWPAELTTGSIGSATVQPGGIYRTWNGVCTPYVNAPPSARIASPSWGTSILNNQNLTISVDTSDPDTSTSRVDFYANGSFLGTDTSAPFSWTVSAPLPTGTFDLTSVAFDGSTRGPDSNVSRLTVNPAPTVTLTSPANGATIPVGSSVTLSASTTGSIGSVSFYAFIGGQWILLGTDSTAPYSIVVGPVGYGDYPIGALANGTVQSQIHTVYVR